jgi:uncharacterized membrane protein
MSMILLAITTLFSGLIAGLFYAWSISVTAGLARIDNSSYLKAFQAMNRAILNPFFFIAFFGVTVLLIYLTIVSYSNSEITQFFLILSATVLYLVGVMVVTIAGNIPLNNKLEALKIESMTEEEKKNFRVGFESKWNSLNMFRTICSSISFLLLIITCIKI